MGGGAVLYLKFDFLSDMPQADKGGLCWKL